MKDTEMYLEELKSLIELGFSKANAEAI